MSFFPQNVSISLFRKSEIGVSCGRTGPAGLRGLRKQVIGQKKGSWSSGGRRCAQGEEEREGKGAGVLPERESHLFIVLLTQIIS